ncbi:MAG: hypothetical protein A3E79_16675 [Burkholderiales bacterium RIFCSPHIGHO2_12_FULL_61_11]|nr:MAG: hypothetical protein A3E79_16675 [Burkholderiales bacterium RIFCSPHIGHO2_12_FULL_61_11]
MTAAAHPARVLLCRRNAEGHIVALTRQLLSAQEVQAGGWEVVRAAAAEVEAFLHEVSTQANPLSQTDSELARVLEDLIDVLINRGLIQFTDLPKAAQAKLLERRQTRAQYAHRLELLPDDSEADLF